MPVFRVEKKKNFTVMSNHHLTNRHLSLKAKGLFSQMLSLPDIWNYSIRGLASLNIEGVDAIRSAICELEREGYIKRIRERSGGRFTSVEYIIHEEPQE